MAVRGQRAAGVDRRRAFEVREPTARLLHHDLARGEVPRFQVNLGVDLRLALGEQPVAEVLAEPPLAAGGVDETDEAAPVARLADEPEARVQERGAAEIADARHA